MKRDLTRAQFESKCAKQGFRYAYFGYWYVTENCLVHAANAGQNYRAQLRYLVKARAKHVREAKGA